MKTKILSYILAILIISSACPSYASETSSDNSDGKIIEFQLVDSTPQNSDDDVELDTSIKLLFNKNVVNFSIKENNLECIRLTDENGQTIPAEIIFPDDQIEPDKKREIYIDPVENLNENTTYIIEISPDMIAKNGSILGEAAYVSFTTLTTLPQAATETETDEPIIKQTEESIKTPDTSQSDETLPDASAPQVEEEAIVITDEASSDEISSEEKSAETLKPTVEVMPIVEQENVEEAAESESNLFPAVLILLIAALALVVHKKLKKS